jgi:hypothetical protein
MSVALSRSILERSSLTSIGEASEARKASPRFIQNLLSVGQTKRAKKHQELMTAAPIRPACTAFALGMRVASKIPSSVQDATIRSVKSQVPDFL